jgi:hypothetical protein
MRYLIIDHVFNVSVVEVFGESSSEMNSELLVQEIKIAVNERCWNSAKCKTTDLKFT